MASTWVPSASHNTAEAAVLLLSASAPRHPASVSPAEVASLAWWPDGDVPPPRRGPWRRPAGYQLLGATAAAAAAAVSLLALKGSSFTGPAGAPASARTRGALGLAAVDFDCDAGVKNWQMGWSNLKKDWCCKNKSVACSKQEAAFDCTVGLATFDAGWSVPKKRWCCLHQGKGCNPQDDLKATWVFANVDYSCLVSAEFLEKNFEEGVKSTLVSLLRRSFGIAEKDIALKYWVGSALHSVESELPGVVVRATILMQHREDYNGIKGVLEGGMFEEQSAQEVNLVLGSCVKNALTLDVRVEPQIGSLCTCQHGLPAGEPQCPKAGGEMCQSCDGGYHLTTSGRCELHQCLCPHGVAASGEACPQHKEVQCETCHAGHHYNTKSKGCEKNRCSCAMGYGATGTACEQDQAAMCGSCYPGFQVDVASKECVRSMCTCSQGRPVEAKDCPKTGKERCATCEEGFHVDTSFACTLNVCICKNGAKAVGAACSRHGANICASCDAGLFLHQGQCSSQKTCVCHNGMAAVGEDCSTNAATICKSCNTGFYKVQDQCISDQCVCQNGRPSTKTCMQQGGQTCASCNEGYRLVGDQCVPRQCTCAHGVGAVGKVCHEDGADSCISCDTAYHLSLDAEKMECKPNQCSCSIEGEKVGIPASGSSCIADGLNICVECRDGYFMKEGETACSPKQCLCAHGTPVYSKDCYADSLTDCRECEAGYFLAGSTGWTLNPDYGSFDARPYEVAWSKGSKVCLPHGVTTSKAYDCSAAFANWELAWSSGKKAWCCTNERRGCIPRLTATDACADKGFTSQQCATVGCCQFDEAAGKCLARADLVGALCHPEFKIVAQESGLCMREVVEVGLLARTLVVLDECVNRDQTVVWRPNRAKQIRNGESSCLTVTANSVVQALPCSQKASYAKQSIQYLPSTLQLQHVGTTDCLTTAPCQVEVQCRSGTCMSCVITQSCTAGDSSQSWNVQIIT